MSFPAHARMPSGAGPPAASPFDLNRPDAYRRWRDARRAARPARPEDLLVEIADPTALTAAERGALAERCRRANMAVYRLRPGTDAGPETVLALGRQMGLERLDRHLCAAPDGVARICAAGGAGPGEYIPYTRRAIGWHTDGYYNPPGAGVGGVIMHCVSAAARGGANLLLDPEQVYMRLRDADPGHVAALAHPRAMTIPANVSDGRQVRPAVTGPVFSVAGPEGVLHMRYTARTRSVAWRDDRALGAAVACLEALLADPPPEALRVLLEPGQGIICNNVLHTREAFEDPQGAVPRLLLRARYRDRVAPC